MGERPSRGGSHRNGELCSGKTSRISSVRVCGWIHSESPAARQSSEWFLATAYLRIKTSDFDLWSRQAVSGGPGRIAIFVGRSPRRAPTSSFGLQRRCRLHYSSSVKPIFKVTCHSPTLPSSTYPRVSLTSNHRMLRTVFWARANAFYTASSNPFGDEPTISIFL